MASDPFSVEPPSWYQRIAQPPDIAPLARMAGRFAGGAASAAETQPGQEKSNYYQRFRGNVADSYKTDQDPMWRIKEMRLKTEMAQFGLNVESYRFKNQLLQKQALQEAQAMQETQRLQEMAQQNGGGPDGVLATTYDGSNPKVQTFWNNAQLMASRQKTTMRLNSDKTHWNKLIDSLDIEDRAVAMGMPRDPNTGLPATETMAFINQSAARVTARKELEQRAKVGGDLVFEDFDIGGNKFTGVRQEGKGGFRLIPHESKDENKLTYAKWNQAARIYRDAVAALSDFKKTLKPEQVAVATQARDAAKKDMDALELQMSNPAEEKPSTPDATDGTIRTKSEFDALPSGAIYTGKDGRKYRKP